MGVLKLLGYERLPAYGLQAARALADTRRWRVAGVREYRLFIELIHREPGIARYFTRLFGAGVLTLGIINICAQLDPLGPHGIVQRGLNVAISLVMAAAGFWWRFAPFPSMRRVLIFVAGVDLLVPLDVGSMSSPEGRIAFACVLSFIGLFICFAFGWRIMLLHVIFSLGVVAGLTAWAHVVDHRALWALAPFIVVDVLVVAAVPAGLQFVVDVARSETIVLTEESIRDPLTGALNRRGWETLAPRFARRCQPNGVVVFVAVDIDRFKEINDSRGHSYGDAVLQQTAARLKAVPRAALVARPGGDEFVLAADLASPDEVESFAQLCAQHLRYDDATFTVSIGVAYRAVVDGDRRIAEVVDSADAAMYEVKRAGGDGYLVAHPE
ncbi:GGDEF domain-containing protein [Tsukamurella soli]|uniref:GGDEF domain-containing protein n=1 Tax=Tsukamurella soli TaxID=644556 RepID=A0ABP8K9T4_9ACTN